MKISIKPIIVAATAFMSLNATAQNTLSGYFLEDYTYRYQLNPAYGNSKGFVSMPGLGNMRLGVNGSLGVSDVIYNVNGKTTTFLNPGVSTDEVLSNIKDMNRFDFNTKVNLLSVGFKGFGGYNTLSINAKSYIGIKVPGSVFRMLKEGITNETYNIANLKSKAIGYAEVALGHSRQVNPEWRVGATLKFLAGGVNADVDFRSADLELGTDSWNIRSDADMHVNMKGFTYKKDKNETTNHYYVNGADVDNPGLGGIGFAVDLGAVYTPKFLPGLELSASILDLGFINWSNDLWATTNGVKTFQSDKYTFNVDGDAPNSFDNEWTKIKDELSNLYELDDKGDQGSAMRSMAATILIGAEYPLPHYNKLKFGLLNTTRVNGDFSWTDFRLSANYMPSKFFDLTGNFNMGTFGAGFGWLMNLHMTGFNLFAGMDHTIGKLAKQGVPLNSNADLTFGINFLF